MVNIVVCSSNKNVDWTLNFDIIQENVFIYNECNEAIAYLKYIIEFYDKLQEFTFFICNEEYSEHHSGSLIDIFNVIKKSSFNRLYYNINDKSIMGSICANPLYGEIAIWYDKYIEPYIPQKSLHYSDWTLGQRGSSQFIVHKSRITKLPLVFYQSLYNWLLTTEMPSSKSCKFMEYTWHIFWDNITERATSRTIYQSQIANFKPQQKYGHYSNTSKLAIIIDPRFDNMMEGTINLFMHYLFPNGWNLAIVSAEKFRTKICEKFPFAHFCSIDQKYIIDQENPNITIESYNDICMSLTFWESFSRYENICIFQKDCYIYRYFTDMWLDYDFVGPSWYSQNDIAPKYGGINGGFSLRKRMAMIECLKKISWDDITAYRKNISVEKQNEDVFYTHACEILNMNCPSAYVRNYFATEAEFNIDTCGYHGWNKNYQTVKDSLEILIKNGHYICEF